jgi:hypothetical protein
MRITIEKLKEFQALAEASKRSLRPGFDQAHETFNNQHSVELKAISEYTFWDGYTYAMLKIIKYIQLKPSRESNPLYKI